MIQRNRPSLDYTFFLVIVGTIIVAMALVGYIWISQEYKKFNKDSRELKSAYIEAQKLMLKNEVERAVDLIHFSKSQTETRLKQNIKNRVHEAYAIAMNIFLENKGKSANREIAKMIKDALRPIRFNQGRGYFFAGDFKGIEQLFADRPELEGKKLLEMQDTDGKFVIKDMIALVKKEGAGFYRYTWTKPNAPGQGFPKISYVKHFEPFDWFIGTGEYIDDVESDVQRELLERISHIRFDTYGYIFVGQWDGLSLLDPGKGKNMWDVEDVNGVKIVQELIKVAKSEGGYVEYILPKFEGYRSTLKISYTKGIKDWQWYVGAGKFMDEIDATIEQRRIELKERVNNKIVQIILILLGVIVIIAVISRFISQKIRNNFQVFAEFFKRTVSSSTHVDATKLNFSEFINLAKTANDMVDLRNTAEESLRRWQHIFENAKWGIAISAAGKTIFDTMNPEFARMHGYTVEELTGQPVSRVLPPVEHPKIGQYIRTAEEEGHITFESLHMRKDGSTFPAYNDITGVKDDTGEALYRVVNIQDISETKKAAEKLIESEEKYRNLVNNSQDLIYRTDETGVITFISPSVKRLSGYTVEEAIGMNMAAEVYLNSAEREKFLFELTKNGDIQNFETELKRKDGSIWWASTNAHLLKDNNGHILGVEGITHDITDRKQAEEKIKVSLKEKEILLQEIHHRVKNNMQVISSLLRLQANSIEDNRIKEILKESQGRVFAMSAVHETLHGSNNLSEIDLETYLSKVTLSIFQTYLITQGKIKLNMDVEKESIDINQASPLGLIVNELLSNSMKYAFPEDRQGEITVSLKKMDHTLEIVVMDDGIGMPVDFDWKGNNSLGLQLVRTLVENQLEGSIDMESANGTKFTIRFPLEKP